MTESGAGTGVPPAAFGSPPTELVRRLRGWIDLAAAPPAEFWRWLGAIVPALPPPGAGTVPEGGATSSAPELRLRELAAQLVDCASDRARLTMACEKYVRDNQLLARRVKALESVIRTAQRAGANVAVPGDPESSTAAERYLPRRPTRP